MLRTNTVLGNRYLIVRQIGEGGMGAVYLAKDNRLGNYVALKQTFYSDIQMLRAFEREARLLARLRHSALPKVIDYFDEAGAQFLVMEFIAGDDLEELLAQRPAPFEIKQVLRWADQLLDALEYLHNQEFPILHRDIKPSNLKVSSGDQIILLDFGLAKGTSGQMTSVATNRSVLGFTPNFAPLEQIQGTGTDPRSDLYALGATIYYLITGIAPSDALTRATAVVSDLPDSLTPAMALLPVDEVDSPLIVDVTKLLERAMALSPKRRPSSAADMRQTLRNIRLAHANWIERLMEERVREKRLPRPTIPSTPPIPIRFAEDEAPSGERPQATLKAPRPNVVPPSPQTKSQPRVRPDFVADSNGKIFDNRVPMAQPRRVTIKSDRASRSFAENFGVRRVWTITALCLFGAMALAGLLYVFDPSAFVLVPSTQLLKMRLAGHAGEVNAVAISPDGKTIASGSDDKTVRLWDAQTGSARVLVGHANPVVAVAFSEDGNTVSSVDVNSSKYWNVRTGQEIVPRSGALDSPSRQAYYGGPTMTSNGALSVYTQGREMVLLDVAWRNELISVSADSKSAKSAAISRDGKFAVSGGTDGTVKIWDLSSYAK